MSRPRVITGVDDRGRPKAAWADAEPDTSKGYGHMEPAFVATVERRKATPEELAAARAREAKPRHLAIHPTGSPFTSASPFAVPAMAPREVRSAIPDAERTQASRQRGAERHVEVMAARKPAPAPEPSPEEETTVSEPRADHDETIPGPPVDVSLDRLSAAAESARIAWDAKAATDTAWEVAREALARAYAEVEWIVEPLPPPDDDHAHYILSVDLHDALAAAVERVEEPEPESPAVLAAIAEVEASIITPGPAIGGGPAPRRNVREARTSGLTSRQTKAIELMQGGKTRAEIARLLGTTYQTVDGLLEAAAKKKLLPIELIPLLPARFAKYSGV